MAGTEKPPFEIVQPERIGLVDLVLAAALAALTFGLLSLWSFPGLHPGVWNDAVVAAGVRPATQVMPGLWTALARGMYGFLGVNGGETALRVFGRLSLAGVAALSYLLIREVLAFVLKMRSQLSERCAAVIRLASALGSLAFVAADPVWTCGQCLSETTLQVALTVAALDLHFLFLRKGVIAFAYAACVVLGLLAAETPFGFLLSAGLVAFYVHVARTVPNLDSPLLRPSVMQVCKWHMTFLYVAALVAGMSLNAWMHIDTGGLTAIGKTAECLPLEYVMGYWKLLASAADFMGWLVLAVVFLVPFVISMALFPSAADDEKFLPYVTGLFFAFFGLLALSQVSFPRSLWIWSHCPVKSPLLSCLGFLCNAFTLAAGIVTLGVDSLCRDHHRLAVEQFGANEEDWPLFGMTRTSACFRRVGVTVIPAVMACAILSGLAKSTTRQMLGLVRDTVRAVVTEAGDARHLFTDGFLDTALELEAASRGRCLNCLSLVGYGGAMAARLRLRGMPDDPEDRFSFGFDAATGLRSWIRDKPARLKDVAVMMGFDLWKREGKPLPPMGGFLSRPNGFAGEADRQKGIAVAHALADRALAVCRGREGIAACADARVADAFVAVLWRLARMCTYRSEAADLAARADTAVAEAQLAKRLNDRNPTFRKLVDEMEKARKSLMRTVTPREGLQLALFRADFALAKDYAERILGVDPDNPDANFAMGMYHLQRKQLSQAEACLTRSLLRKARAPSVYNNLAMIQIQQRRFDDAAVNVRKALALVPGSAAVLDTQKRLEEARRKQ